jgi:hypothetical protein
MSQFEQRAVLVVICHAGHTLLLRCRPHDDSLCYVSAVLSQVYRGAVASERCNTSTARCLLSHARHAVLLRCRPHDVSLCCVPVLSQVYRGAVASKRCNTSTARCLLSHVRQTVLLRFAGLRYPLYRVAGVP